MKKICVIIFCVSTLCFSCGVRRTTIAHHTIKADTVILYKNTVSSRVDTLAVQMFDTVRYTQKGDTVILEKIQKKIIYRNKIKTDTLILRDNVVSNTQNIDSKVIVKEKISFKAFFFLAGILAATLTFIFLKLIK
ncbi:MAG: hypothetical protein FWF72_02235 [Paludibacter sp.]|nr:hypothetical protein [Paludibacter sp.]